VDSTCIDCGTCFHLAPDILKEKEDASVVSLQPENLDEWTRSRAAILSCPTNSIGVHNGAEEFKNAPQIIPLLIADNVYYCGFSARSSFGASSYFIVRPEGNILIDSPRFHPFIVRKLEELGGISHIFLTNRDDVADHQSFAKHFKAKRIIHELEVEVGTHAFEIILNGVDDWDFSSDLKILFTPGHTQGHLCLLYKNKYLFSGDHLFYSPARGSIYAFKSVNWYSWTEQKKSLIKLLNYQFSWIFAGHGGWIQKDESSIKV